jgi:hypothetical protein
VVAFGDEKCVSSGLNHPTVPSRESDGEGRAKMSACCGDYVVNYVSRVQPISVLRSEGSNEQRDGGQQTRSLTSPSVAERLGSRRAGYSKSDE